MKRIAKYDPDRTMCPQTEEVVRLAVEEAGIKATIDHLTDRQAVLVSGVLPTQAVAVDGSVS